MSHTIQVPSSLAEITVNKYQDFVKRSKGVEGDALDVLTVSIFCDIETEAVNYMSASDVISISKMINALFTMDQELIRTTKIEGVKIGLVPELDKLTFGEYIDLDENINDWEKIHIALSVLYRPITKQVGDRYSIQSYRGEDYELSEDNPSYIECMKLLTMDVALGAVVFFYALGKELLETTRVYLVEQLQNQITQNGRNSLSSGDGIHQSINYLTDLLADSMTPLKPIFTKH
tara:strand:- start:1112 stop:1810 length:699 start_codon:yes stop_codon:yes gene_type:complete